MSSSDSSGIKSLRVLHGDDCCDILLYDGMEPGALVHALAARFRLGQLPFHLTHSENDAIVPLSSALPTGLTLCLHVDENLENLRSNLIVQDLAALGKLSHASTFEPVLSTRSFLQNEEQTTSVHGIAMKTMPGQDLASGCTPLLQDRRCQESHEPAQSSMSRVSSVADTIPDTNASAVSADNASFIVVETMNEVGRVVDRFSRISSELANERTLLAWIRTGLAAIRTVFAFLPLAATSNGWQWVILFAEMAMMTAVLFSGVSGTLRYKCVRSVLKEPEAPQDFGRYSVMWFNGMVAIASVACAAGIYTQGWTRG